jgi:hypothetical protein
MKTRQLDPQNLGLREDWLGNNAAFECPVCGKVYIATGFPPKCERHCPGGGKSCASVTTSASNRGKAEIIWDDMPSYSLGNMYSRKQISADLGGGEVDFLPSTEGRVVCGCFTLDHNPAAPNIVIPGTGKGIERTAELFCKQDYPVPIFIKRHPNEWEYVGYYKADHFPTDPAVIAANHNGSITPISQITRVIFLKRC